MKLIKGIAGSPGIAHARVLEFKKSEETKQTGERISFDQAVTKALDKVKKLHDKALAEIGGKEAKIFVAYEMLLEDTMLTGPIKAAIDGGEDEAKAIGDICGQMAAMLAGKSNEYMRRRADDIRYVGELLTDMVNGADSEFDFPAGNEKYILVSHELTPMDTMHFDTSRLAGLVTELGGATSHTVILAKSLGIPAVVGAKGIDGTDGETAYLDGYSGEFVVSPDEMTEAEYSQKLAAETELTQKLDKIRNSRARTSDGKEIHVCVNIGSPDDMNGYTEEHPDGVGLFRTEFLYSAASKKPTVEEQTKAYREVFEKSDGTPVTVRTLDIGGDKLLTYMHMDKEDNPFLGNRGIRLCLNNPDIFAEQIRALLIAAHGMNAKIMLPMITSVSEIDAARKVIKGVCAELDAEGIDYAGDIPVGIMIETPASAMTADIFARHADFFSVGTNDLVQYINAADRGNAAVESVYNPYHPAVVRALANVIRCGADAGIEVSVCGDLAANLNFTELLIGLGLKKFSVPLPMAVRVKHKISTIDSAAAQRTAQTVLEAENENEIKSILERGCAQ